MSEFSPLERQLLELKDVSDQLPVLRPAVIQPPTEHRCRACGEKFGELEFGRHWTGVVWVRDLLCCACAGKFIKDTCQLACLTCQVIATRMQKLKDQSGFVFEAGRFYHTKECPECLKLEAGQQAKVSIIELEQHKQHIYGNHR